MIVFRKCRGRNTDGNEPMATPIYPVAMPFGPIIIVTDEILHLHLLEFAATEYEVARSDFIAKRFTDLSDAKRDFYPARVENGDQPGGRIVSRLARLQPR